MKVSKDDTKYLVGVFSVTATANGKPLPQSYPTKITYATSFFSAGSAKVMSEVMNIKSTCNMGGSFVAACPVLSCARSTPRPNVQCSHQGCGGKCVT
eukprot:5035471-Amphidinium_carterae.1